MARRLRLKNAIQTGMANDATRGLSLVLAARTLATLTVHAAATASFAAARIVGVAAAIGVFASLAVHLVVGCITASASTSDSARPDGGVVTEQRGVTHAGLHQGALES